IPIGAESDYIGLIDLIDQCAYIYHDEMGLNIERTEIPADMADEAAEHRSALIELIAETDEELLMRYLEGEELIPDELRAALRKATISNELVPVLNGTALKNKGIQRMLDAVVDYLPSPLDIPPVQGVEKGPDGEEIPATRPT